MDIPITGVEKSSAAHRAGLRTGDLLLDINGQPVVDFIDLNYLSSAEELTVRVLRKGRAREIAVRKDAGEPLGLDLGAELYPAERRCANRCVFCFVDQLPGGVRPSLRVKDDDWRYSMLFGNYVTLTNVTDAELRRIVDRQVSPLYISVHSTDGSVRAGMMGNPAAAGILRQLRILARGGIVFHCQIVLCPGINDAEALKKTLADLYGLYPAARSVAVVPLGLTAFRDGLAPLRPVGAEEARQAVAMVEAFAQGCRQKTGEPFAYAADELYQRAGLPWPRYTEGCPIPQMSNGVGLMDDFVEGFHEALAHLPAPVPGNRRVTVATGTSAAGTMEGLCRELSRRADGLSVRVVAVENRLFGPSVTVAGLLGGADILEAVGTEVGDALYIPASALRESDEIFLDDKSRLWLERSVGAPVIPVPDDGYEFVRLLLAAPDGESDA